MFLLALVAAACAVGGCGLRIGGNATISAENDRLRSENADLKTKIEGLERREQEFRRKIEATPGTPAADAVAATPVLTTFEIASTSHTRPAQEGRTAAAVVHLACRDGRDRALQVTGSLRVAVSVNGALIAERTLSPLELRDAYRGGLGGGGYTVEVPLSAEHTMNASVEAEFTDAFGRGAYKASRDIAELDRPKAVPGDAPPTPR